MSAVGFSFKSVLVKIAYGYGVDPMTLMLMRMFIAFAFLSCHSLLDGRKKRLSDKA